MIPRTFHHIARLNEVDDHDYSKDTAEERNTPVDESAGNVISSRIEGTRGVLGGFGTEDEWMHAPVLDIDFPCALIPSSTPGHFHLYIDKPMTWAAYARILEAFRGARVLEEGYVEASLNRRATFVRKPFVSKVVPEPEPTGTTGYDMTGIEVAF